MTSSSCICAGTSVFVILLSCYQFGYSTGKTLQKKDFEVDIFALENLRQEAAQLSVHAESWSNYETLNRLFKTYITLYKRDYVSDKKEYGYRQAIFMVSYLLKANLKANLNLIKAKQI